MADQDLQKWAKSIGRESYALQESLESYHIPLKFAPDKDFVYGSGLDWAGVVLEKVTGKTLVRYIEENVFTPAGMTDTGFWPDASPERQRRMLGWSTRSRRDGTLASCPSPMPQGRTFESGGGGLLSAVCDLGCFFGALAAGKAAERRYGAGHGHAST